MSHKALAGLIFFGGAGYLGYKQSAFEVEPGKLAVVYNVWSKSISDRVYDEGQHYRIPFIQKPIIYNTTTEIAVWNQELHAGGKGMGYADVQVKYKIDANNLIKLHRLVGKDYGSIALGNSLSDLFQQTLNKYVTSNFEKSEVRDCFAKEVKDKIESRANRYYVIVEDFALENYSKQGPASYEEWTKNRA